MKLYEPPTKEFFRLTNNIFDLGLTPIQFTLYSYLVSCAGSSTICWPSLKTICAKTGIGLTAVQDHLKVLEKRQIIQIGKRKTKNGNWNNEYTLLSLDNPEVYRDLSCADDELPLFIGDELSAEKSAFRKKVFESGIKEVFRLMPDTSESHPPATTCGAFTRFPRCYLFRIARKNRRLEMENA